MTDLILERFWEKVQVNSSTGCWVWRGSLQTNSGYGRFWYNNKTMGAHRFSYQINKGQIPEGLELDHLCRNRKCVNPEHLEAVTRQENVIRGVGVAAINFKKTHCPRGHQFTIENMYLYRNGRQRICKTCQKIQGRNHRR